MKVSTKTVSPALWLAVLPLLTAGLWFQARKQSNTLFTRNAQLTTEAEQQDETLNALNATTLSLQLESTSLRDEIRRGFAIPGLNSTQEESPDKSDDAPEKPSNPDPQMEAWKKNVVETRNLLLREAAFRKDAAATPGLSNAAPLFERYAVLLESWDPVLAVFGEAEDLREQNRILNLLRNQELKMNPALLELREQRFAQILTETGLRQDQGLRVLLESIRQEDVDFPRGFLHLRIMDPPEQLQSPEAAP
jgi:hypothetical protein